MASVPEQGELGDAYVDSDDLAALKAVRPPHALRKLAVALALLFFTLPIALLLVPWQQNVSGTGRVTAFNPLDRTQIIPAPVTGRLVRLDHGDRAGPVQLYRCAERGHCHAFEADDLGQQEELDRLAWPQAGPRPVGVADARYAERDRGGPGAEREPAARVGQQRGVESEDVDLGPLKLSRQECVEPQCAG